MDQSEKNVNFTERITGKILSLGNKGFQIEYSLWVQYKKMYDFDKP